MRLHRMKVAGCLALLCGVAFMAEPLLARQSISLEEMAVSFGGACQTSARARGCRVGWACRGEEGDRPGKLHRTRPRSIVRKQRAVVQKNVVRIRQKHARPRSAAMELTVQRIAVLQPQLR